MTPAPSVTATEREPAGSFAVAVPNLKVQFGHRSVKTIGEEIRRIGGTRALVVVGRSLGGGDLVLPALLDALDGFAPTVFCGARTHAPIDHVEATAQAAREAGVDVLVSLGGGSAVDVAKGASMRLTGKPLEHFKRRVRKPGERPIDAFFSGETYVCPPVVAVSTTLSGAEFTGQAGLTWPDRHEKDQFYHGPSAPRLVVLDRAMTAETPSQLWRASGVKCLDHCVERLYSVHSQPICNALSTEGASVLLDELGTASDAPDLAGRTRLLIAAWMAQLSTGNVNVGLDHAIGHQLGSLAGVGHGEAAAVTMPHVFRFNAAGAPEAARALARLAWKTRTISDDTEVAEAAEAMVTRIEELIRRLGLPTRLRDLGVGAAILPEVARRSIDDTAITGNPRHVSDANEILGLLERAW